MTDVSVKSAKKKKRKLTSPNEKQRPSKTRRVDSSEKKEERREVEGIERLEHRERNAQLEEERPWRNLQLILLLQNKEVDIEKKVELAFHFVKALMRGGNSLDEDYETVKISRLIAFLSDWVQSLLISRDQKVKVEAGRNQSRVFEACLDFRCWDIFKFCLEESLKLHVSLNLSRNLLRAIGFISRNLLSLLHNKSLCLKESFFTDEGFETYGLVLDCVALLFSSRGGLMNENLDLWISTIGAVLELVHNIYAQNLEGHDVAAFVLKFSCLVLEPFAKFLRVHPTRKNGFRDFVDKLLDPLLHLLGVLHLEVNESAPGWTRNLIKLVQEVLSNGLFQPAHIDGFLGLHCTGKYVSSQDGKSEDIKMVLKSYHRHLFDKLESIMAAKKEMVLTSIGEIFHLLVDRVRKQKGALVQYEGGKIIAKPGCSKQMDNDLSSHISRNTSSGCSTLPEKSYCSSNLSGETRKSLFDFFVQLMEPLLLEMNGYILDELEIGVLSDIHCTLKCSNKLLSSLMREKIYVKTEDISNGACLNFLRKVYDMKVSVGCRLLQLAQLNLDNRAQEMFTLSAKELLVAVGYLLDIEYEVIGNDLVGLWLMVLSYLAIGHSSVDALGQSILTSDILGTGCQLVYLYSELRQVNNTIFALCKAVRLMTSHDADGEVTHTRFLSCTTSLPHEQIAKSVEALLVSQELKLAIHKAIKSIPEGQASGCIRQLMMDMSESMEWMKVSCLAAGGEGVNELNVRSSMLRFELQAEVLGRGLSEIYAVVLDSLTVTTGNSNLLGLAINDLMTVICPSMSSLVAPQSDRVKEFLFSVTGRNFDDMMADNKDKEYVVSTQWIIVFLFRLYISCRGLCRQIIGLMPPDSSKKMSAVMGDPFSACSGKDWMAKTDWTDDGYFSWIGQPSASLFDIIKSISDIYLRDKISYCYPLVYVLHTMALQRLVDLNRHINTLEYLLQSNDNLVQAKLFDADGLSKSRKRSRKLQRHILGLKQEAEYLTDFMIGYLSLVVDDQLPVSSNCHPTAHFLDASDKWDLVVSTINKKLLPVALWWILCQNIDIWCSHAATKKLKKFLSLLLRTSIPCVSSSSYMVGNHKMGETRKKKITVHQISSELLCDSILYEHKFVRRNLASRFCHILEESVLQLFDDFSTEDINFSSSPNWPEVLSALNKLSVVVSGRKQVAHDSVKKSHSLSSSQLPTEICKEQGASGLTRMKFTACQNLLNLLCRMPKGYLNLKSFRIIATHILNLERVVIDSLLRCQATLSSHQQHELFRLFVSCRRTLKCVIMASCEEITGDILSSLLPIVPEGSSLVLWLFKSVYTVVGLQGALLEDSITESRHMIFSLMDNTSYVFLTISKYQFSRALHLFIAAKEPSKEQHSPSFSGEQKTSNEYDLCSDSSKGIEDCRNVLLAAESLKEQMQCLQITLKDAFRNDNARGVNVVSLNKLSSILSCLGGFLWGLSSAMNQIDPKKNVQKTFRWTCEPLSKLNICMDVFSDFVSVFLQLLFVEDDGRSRGLSNEKSSQKDFECSRDSGDVQSQNLGAVRAATASSNLDDGATRNSSLLEDIDSSVNVMTEVELGELQCLNKHFMHSLLKGDHPEAAYSLRQLLIVSSATLRFNLYMNGTPLSSSLVSIVVGISQVLLSGLVDMVEAPEPFSFVWLDGVLKYLEELGSHFPLTSHTLTRNVYSELIELHLRAIGKCISLQGKRATLASHETESSNKMFHGDIGLSEPSLSYGPYCLDEFKTRLRMSFKVFVEKSSELHLLSAIQAIERALVGVWEGCTTVYGIKTGNADGGKVSSTVGAGIDCLDLILEYVSGRKRLNVVKRHIQSLVAALFNVILHLQSPSIFYTESVSNKGGDYPDPGSVILMCIEVLTRVSGKHVLFQMDSWHIGQSIHIPAAIFCDLHQLITSGASIAYNTSMFSDNQQHGHVTSMNYLVVDRQFSITLFAACCRLLYTVLKHHKSESEQCLAVLEESVSALLHSLETVDDDSVLRKGCFSWELEEGVKCACFLRRIYEELRQQKDVFGRHCFKFLSTYIWVYSGYGPLKMGIRREIDEALKPGVYALIDACSADDLQYLHTVFGEGPCRNNLATLQHDYKLNFQYGGKV